MTSGISNAYPFSTVVVKEGEKINPLEDIIKPGNSFAGLFNEKEYIHEFEFDFPVYKDYKL